MAITFRPFKVSADQLIEPRLLHGCLVDLDAKHQGKGRKAVGLAEAGQVVEALRLCVEERMNILISGGTSTGKTTFARSLLSMVEPGERILTIEDAYELFPRQENAVALKADRSAQGERTPARLLEASLRMRPDRIILGELRGEESRTFLEAINTGHGGSFHNHPCRHRPESHRPVGDHGHGRRAGHGVRGGEAVLRGKRGSGSATFAAGWAAWGGGDSSLPLITAKG